MQNLYFGMFLFPASILFISSILAMEVPTCSDNHRLCSRYQASGRCSNPRIAQRCPKSCFSCCLPDTSPMCGKWKDEGLCSNGTVLEQCIQTCTGCCPDNDIPCQMRDLKKTVVETCSSTSSGEGQLTLLDAGSNTLCTIHWTESPTLQTFNIFKGFTDCTGEITPQATQIKIFKAGKGTKISVNGLPLPDPNNGKATSTLILDVTTAIDFASPVVIGDLDGSACFGDGDVKATYFKIDTGVISKRVSTVTISV